MESVAPELAVREGSPLERAEGLDPVVGLPENAEPEHADDDDQERGSHEGDEQLRVDGNRQSADRADDRVVVRGLNTPLAAEAQPQGSGRPPTMLVTEPATVQPGDVLVARGDGRNLPRLRCR